MKALIPFLLILGVSAAMAESDGMTVSTSSLNMGNLQCLGLSYIKGNRFDVENANVANSNPWATTSLANGNIKSSLDRFEVRAGDISCNDVALGHFTVERSELAENTVWPFAIPDFWVAYSVYYVPGAAISTSTISGQVHPATCNAADAFATTTAYVGPGGSDIKFFAVHSTQNPIVDAPTVTTVFTDTGGLVTGQWINFVHHFRFSAGGAALWDAWKNGTQLFHYTGSMGLASCSNNYWKYGWYRNADAGNATDVAWFANVEAGPTDLTARITTPLPVIVGTVH